MRSIFTTLFFTFLALFAFAQQNDEQVLKQLNHDWISAYVTRDTAMMSRIYANDITLVSPNGAVWHKNEMVKNLLSTSQEYLSSKVDTVSVRIIDKIGLVSAKATVVAKANSKTSTIQTSYLDVYEKRDGRWVAIASQVALLSIK
jgi:uncharacterized protein (TIGR02246 family)